MLFLIMNNLRKLLTTHIALHQSINFGILGSSFHSSTAIKAGQDWRRARYLPLNPNKYGPFADSPDYTYLDGRPTPSGSGRVNRALKQRVFANKIVQLTSEVDYAVERHTRLEKEKKDKEAAILSKKLKPKGSKLRTVPVSQS